MSNQGQRPPADAHSEGHQSFRYLSPQLHLVPQDLLLPPCQFSQPRLPEWIHSVCVTERADTVVAQLDEIRANGLEGGLGKGWAPQVIWEPLGVNQHHRSGL